MFDKARPHYGCMLAEGALDQLRDSVFMIDGDRRLPALRCLAVAGQAEYLGAVGLRLRGQCVSDSAEYALGAVVLGVDRLGLQDLGVSQDVSVHRYWKNYSNGSTRGGLSFVSCIALCFHNCCRWAVGL